MTTQASLDLRGENRPGLPSPFLEASAPRLAMPDWVARYRFVEGGAHPGPWRHDNAPMAIEPMTAASTPGITRITLVAPSQLLKSELAINIACYTAMHGDDVLFYEPDLPLVKEFLGDRIRPVMARIASVEATGLGGWQKKRDSNVAIRLGGGGKILGLSPDMRTGRSSHTARVAVIDELDKMARTDMVTVAKERTSTYQDDALIVELSTPTTDGPGTSWRSWAEGSRGVWRGRCPECAELVSVNRGMVNFDRDPGGYWLPETAALVCAACGVRWTEAQRQVAIRAGCYVHDDPENPHQSYHVPGPAHLWRTIEFIFTEGAAAYKAAIDDGDWVRYQAWVNGFAAEPWTDDDRGLSTAKMQRASYSLGARGERDRGELDPRVLMITTGTDTGDHAIFTEWVAWGLDIETLTVRTWGLQYQVIGGSPDDSIEDPELWRAFDRALTESVWRHPHFPGVAFGPWRGCIDTGHRPEIVKAWTAAKMQEAIRTTGAVSALPFGARMLPMKSKSRETGDHPVDLRVPANYRKQIWPLTVSVESNQLKDAMYESQLRDGQKPEGVERANHTPVDRVARGYTDSWFNEMANETKAQKRSPRGVITTYWEIKRGIAKKNEAWDCRVYAMAAAMVEIWPQPLRDGMIRLADREASARGIAGERCGPRAPGCEAVRTLEGYSSPNVVHIGGDNHGDGP